MTNTHTHTSCHFKIRSKSIIYMKEDNGKYQGLDSSDLRKKRSYKRDKCNNFGDQ